MSAITIGGDLIHYEKLGRGRPVILVHGWVGSWRYWIPLMQQLHLRYSVYTLDLIGFGDSSKNPERYTISHQVNMLNRFMEQLGIIKAAFIGHGLGALITTEFSLRYPDKVARIILASMPLFDPGDLNERTPPDEQVLLTPYRDRYSLAPTIPNTREDDDRTIYRPGGAADEDADTVLGDEEQTRMARPISGELPTIGRGNNIDRQQLVERARRLAEERQQRNPALERTGVADRRAANGKNHLFEHMRGRKISDLLDRCFKRSEPEYDKLRVDVEKADNRALIHSVRHYDAGVILDSLHHIQVPLLLVHGADDPVLPAPSDEVWHYLTRGSSENLVPIALPGVRHFPMLEHEAFSRLTNDFLESADVSKLEVRERWRRRSR